VAESAAIQTEDVGSWTRRVRVMAGEHTLTETSKDVIKALGSLDAYAEQHALLLEHIERIEPDVVRERALLLLGHRERTRQELLRRLTGEGFTAEIVTAALDHFEEIGALSDARYAEIFARSKIAAGWSRKRIERRLTADGCSKELARTTLDELTDDSDDLERACALIDKLDLEDPRIRNRALGRLARRGFSPSQAFAALDKVRSRADLAI
jgi:regulatory protein